ncbi:MAG: rhamnogalacturonan acetylesterase [Bacteroidales bacterium]|nr:rhamnogalacturonan acetylesterase [Bacteroidales bacterium]MBN2763274.1 rhamnogalacturonan acetylesterase [Bacteroidales bacterium]
MKKNLLWPVLLIFLSAFLFPKKTITVYMIGDSTMANKPVEDNPERGWGMMLQDFFDSSVIIENHAMNGRSTRSFLNENRWQPIVDKLKKGDYVIIQFGHNDESKNKKGRYTTPEEFRQNIVRYVNETRSRKALPILCTPLMRRRFNDNGEFYDTHGVYPNVVRNVADSMKVPLVDLHRKSEKLICELGPEGSKKMFLFVEPGIYTSLPDGREDNTHFSEWGACKVACLFVEGIFEQKLSLRKRLKEQ